MTINESIVDEYTPVWTDDVLNSSATAKFLTKYLNALFGDSNSDSIYSDSFVMCLDAEWGFGKTFLLKHWSCDLKQKLNHPVIYFDAWKSDFSDDPLLAFICELEIALKEFKTEKPKVENLINIAKGAIAPTLKVASKIALKKITGSGADEIFEMFNAATDGVVDNYMKNAVENHNSRKEKIENFSNELESLLKDLNNKGIANLPMYVLIDELDRCKPSYAIELLEGIKHIFGTNGVFFIVATNKEQLAHSIKAVYGAEFDSVTYLQRFFDQEYQLPKPNFAEFSKLLIEKKYRLDTMKIEQLNLAYNLEQTFAILAECFSLSLRAQDQVAKQLKAIELNNVILEKTHHWFLLFLMMLRIKNETVYAKVPANNYSRDIVILLPKSVFNFDKNIKGHVNLNRSEQGYQKGGDVRLIDIIDEYLRLESMDLLELRKESDKEEFYGETVNLIKRKIIEREFPQQGYLSSKHYPLSIRNYRRIVEQAGHIC